MAAAYATLRALSDGRAIPAMEVTGKRLMQGIGDILREQGIVAQVAGFPQIFHVAFGLTEPARQVKDLGRSDRQGYVRFCTELLRRRVRALERGAWFLSSAHDNTVIDATLEAVRGAAQAIGDTGEA
jgi:glutamate-1-semialdehyde 2,1-aminomutase